MIRAPVVVTERALAPCRKLLKDLFDRCIGIRIVIEIVEKAEEGAPVRMVAERCACEALDHICLPAMLQQICFIRCGALPGCLCCTVNGARRPEHAAVKLLLRIGVGAVCSADGRMLRIRRIVHPIPCAECRFQTGFRKILIRGHIPVDQIRMGKHCRRIGGCKMRAQVGLICAGLIIRGLVQRILKINGAVFVICGDIERAVMIGVFEP